MASVLDRAAAPPDETTAYGEEPDQIYDVRQPTGPPRGVTVIVVHGGFWRPATDRSHTGSEAVAFAQDGFHVVVPEYRRAARGGWPAMRADLRDVVAAVAARTDLPDRVVLVGHSAGGHLVAWLAAQPETHGVVGTVALAGCVDLHLVHELGLGAGAAEALMGSTPEKDPAGWEQADPARLGGPPAPVVAIHGTRDEHVPLSISQSYTAAVPSTRLRVIDGADHFDVIDPQSAAFAIVRAAVSELADPTDLADPADLAGGRER
ncbi:S9 family peptidase [Allobranchiibius sp. CTAmp26]|uniref:alpha/beta hydrolase family protein n=1 Tax=Allobranchiibius sp. CTAmp26 TaxID=2815214 RepID=UPI001AA1C3E4|nr:alpha/beta hydrolase [Allobranchiibius sp. CTAmp26]MBO1753760.1 alpha/beta hydrolase [Allobranchiibius sp. CTAmp26]